MQRAEAKHLRRIRLPDHAAIHGLQHTTVLVDSLQGVARRNGEQAADRIVRQFIQ
ncbi:hypothetical protein D3C81_1953080 [compost metagenome]